MDTSLVCEGRKAAMLLHHALFYKRGACVLMLGAQLLTHTRTHACTHACAELDGHVRYCMHKCVHRA